MPETEVIIDKDYISIDSLNELISLAESLQKGIQTALEKIFKQFLRPGGALFIFKKRNDSTHWITCNLPVQWNNQIGDPFSKLNKVVGDVRKNGGIFAGDANMELASAFPVKFQGEILGVLLVAGEVIQEADYPKWQTYMESLGWFVDKLQLYISSEYIKNCLGKIEAGQSKLVNGDFENGQIELASVSQEIYDSDGIAFFLIESGKPTRVNVKQLGVEKNWVNQVCFVVESPYFSDVLQDGRILDGEEALDFISKYPEMVSGKTAYIDKFICAPFVINGHVLGGLILENPALGVSDSSMYNLLKLIVTEMANGIYNAQKILEYKISLADLEASRWNILNSRNILRDFFDNIPISVYIIDSSYSLIAINFSRSNRTNKLPRELIGGKCYEKLYSRMSPCMSCRVSETFGTGQSTVRNSREWVDDERFIEWEIKTYGIQGNQQYPQAVVINEFDVTERNALETNLIQSEKLAAVGQLAAGIAHEINNPLAAIIANAQILLRGISRDETEIIESLGLIEAAGLRASQVVSNLLGIVRKQKRYGFEPFSLNESIMCALSLVKYELNSHLIQVNLDLDETLPEIIASRIHIQGVWINLISNSIDAMDKDNKQISISTRYIDKEFQIIISDNGKGIDEKRLPQVFEPFYTTKDIGKGTGLGLAVSLRIIKEHMGNIKVDSKLGVGTKFTVTLPDINRK